MAQLKVHYRTPGSHGLTAICGMHQYIHRWRSMKATADLSLVTCAKCLIAANRLTPPPPPVVAPPKPTVRAIRCIHIPLQEHGLRLVFPDMEGKKHAIIVTHSTAQRLIDAIGAPE